MPRVTIIRAHKESRGCTRRLCCHTDEKRKYAWNLNHIKKKKKKEVVDQLIAKDICYRVCLFVPANVPLAEAVKGKQLLLAFSFQGPFYGHATSALKAQPCYHNSPSFYAFQCN
jgi:hypothetical protein